VASSDISGPVGGVAIHWNNSPLWYWRQMETRSRYYQCFGYWGA
jgi:hypothetical protein